MNDIDRWISGGAGVSEGLRLLRLHAPNPWTEALVTRAPERFAHLLRKALEPLAEGTPLSVRVARGDGSFRREWPFLSDPDCPPELKILASDMITSWHAYVDAHEELFGCATPEECYKTAEKTVKNFSQNSRIRLEFEYYREHRRILGKHPVFADSRRLASLRRMPVTELVRRQRALRENIWRIGHEITKGDRPDLLAERESRLERRRLELSEIDRMIGEYEGTGTKDA